MHNVTVIFWLLSNIQQYMSLQAKLVFLNFYMVFWKSRFFSQNNTCNFLKLQRSRARNTKKAWAIFKGFQKNMIFSLFTLKSTFIKIQQIGIEKILKGIFCSIERPAHKPANLTPGGKSTSLHGKEETPILYSRGQRPCHLFQQSGQH